MEDVFRTRVHAPPHPGDGGLSVGAAWQLTPPLTMRPLQYAGPRLFDVSTPLAKLVERTGFAERVEISLEASVEAVADLLAAGAVVGVARGRSEFGPRALGRRSLLAIPFAGARDAMNDVKFREWWRPARAPNVARCLREIFFARGAELACSLLSKF